MSLPATPPAVPAEPLIDYQTEPSRYRHWKLSVDGSTARLAMDVAEDGGLKGGYKLKLNSYDLGVDIELHDALNRIRFEHPQVRVVVVTSAKERIFCSGANIFMLGLSTHAWKVNFCKFTNETRNGIEDSSRHDGIKFLAAVNGACAGGGYEMALACDRILLVDDRSSSVSLPEVPLLGVLPGTGGLTRIIDKRRVRHDHADIFCTSVEGVRGQRAKDWRLVDAIARPAVFEAAITAEVDALAASSPRPADAGGIALTPLDRRFTADGIEYANVSVRIDRARRLAHLTVRAPATAQPTDIAGIVSAGMAWWPLQMGRELDDAILHLRSNELDIGTWLLRTEGDAAAVLACDAALDAHKDHWLVTATRGLLRRCLGRLDVSSRTMFALVEQGSCFAGTLAELAFAADRIYMQWLPEAGPTLTLSPLNFGAWPMVSQQSRLARRFHDEVAALAAAERAIGQALDADAALALGLVTATPDDIDWTDEIRIACEERAALSPDALTGLEANLRFGGVETMETRIFGRLSAWQNWIFIRPNAVGERGALKVYGRGEKAAFDLKRV
jgi:benzoyl-CoA-dihydrodiol lyase